MSCFIVSEETMHRVVEACEWYDYADKHMPLTNLGSTELGCSLFEMNNDAFRARYDDRYPEDLYDPTAYGYEPREATTGEMYKALACFIYQCSEGTLPDRASYRALVEIREALELKLVGDECPPEQRVDRAMNMVENVPWDF